jgi:hypothetical protein
MADLERESDDRLLAVAGEDAAAFSAFYRRYESAMLAFFARRVGDPELAADLTVEVFAAVLVSCGRYRPDKAPAQAWLFAIAHTSWRIVAAAAGLRIVRGGGLEWRLWLWRTRTLNGLSVSPDAAGS